MPVAQDKLLYTDLNSLICCEECLHIYRVQLSPCPVCRQIADTNCDESIQEFVKVGNQFLICHDCQSKFEIVEVEVLGTLEDSIGDEGIHGTDFDISLRQVA